MALKVAEGCTNREAAAQLFISAKTVEHHLSAAYAKLGIRSRSELARLAAETETLRAAWGAPARSPLEPSRRLPLFHGFCFFQHGPGPDLVARGSQSLAESTPGGGGVGVFGTERRLRQNDRLSGALSSDFHIAGRAGDLHDSRQGTNKHSARVTEPSGPGQGHAVNALDAAPPRPSSFQIEKGADPLSIDQMLSKGRQPRLRTQAPARSCPGPRLHGARPSPRSRPPTLDTQHSDSKDQSAPGQPPRSLRRDPLPLAILSQEFHDVI